MPPEERRGRGHKSSAQSVNETAKNILMTLHSGGRLATDEEIFDMAIEEGRRWLGDMKAKGVSIDDSRKISWVKNRAKELRSFDLEMSAEMS